MLSQVNLTQREWILSLLEEIKAEQFADLNRLNKLGGMEFAGFVWDENGIRTIGE